MSVNIAELKRLGWELKMTLKFGDLSRRIYELEVRVIELEKEGKKI